jgi:hypothetical protein
MRGGIKIFVGSSAVALFIAKALDVPFVARDETCSIERGSRGDNFRGENLTVLRSRYLPVDLLGALADHST